jgi:hypothetical protein
MLIVSVTKESKLFCSFTWLPVLAWLFQLRRAAFAFAPRRFCSLELQFRGWQPPKSFAMGSRKPLKTWPPYSPGLMAGCLGSPDLILRFPLLTATDEKSDFRFSGDFSLTFATEKAQIVAKSEDLRTKPCSPGQLHSESARQRT